VIQVGAGKAERARVVPPQQLAGAAELVHVQSLAGALAGWWLSRRVTIRQALALGLGAVAEYVLVSSD
jgi:hypothetical protein